MTSARVPTLIFASCASATTLAARACASFATVSGLSIRTSTAPASTFCPRTTGISATRPSTRAAMSSRVASTSPCSSSGAGRTRYQMESEAIAMTTIARMTAGAYVSAERGRAGCAAFSATSGEGGAGACRISLLLRSCATAASASTGTEIIAGCSARRSTTSSGFEGRELDCMADAPHPSRLDSPSLVAHSQTLLVGLLERQDPCHYGLEIGVGDVVGRHRHRAPRAAAAVLHLLFQLGLRRLVARVLLGDFLVSRTDNLLVHGMATLAVVLGRQLLRFSGVYSRSTGQREPKRQKRRANQ